MTSALAEILEVIVDECARQQPDPPLSLAEHRCAVLLAVHELIQAYTPPGTLCRPQVARYQEMALLVTAQAMMALALETMWDDCRETP